MQVVGLPVGLGCAGEPHRWCRLTDAPGSRVLVSAAGRRARLREFEEPGGRALGCGVPRAGSTAHWTLYRRQPGVRQLEPGLFPHNIHTAGACSCGSPGAVAAEPARPPARKQAAVGFEGRGHRAAVVMSLQGRTCGPMAMAKCTAMSFDAHGLLSQT